jgi:RHS repeat-associated protein
MIKLMMSLLRLRLVTVGLFCSLLCIARAENPIGHSEQITQSTLFSPPLVWVGEQRPPESDSTALWKILSEESDRPTYDQLQQFVASHPLSQWAPPVQAHIAQMHRSYGRYTLALHEWEAAWLTTKSLTNTAGRSVAEFTLAYWSQLLASLGRTERLAELFKETADWKWQDGNLSALFAQSREGYNTMLNYPGVSYRCGTFALARVARALGNTNAGTFQMIDIDSPANGFCMSKLVELSASNQLNLLAVERPSGSEVIVPSVVHWRQNHYAAIIGKEGSLYWVVDPTFGRGQWMQEQFLNEEASGKFLVPATNVPAVWRVLAKAETDKVFGKGQPSTIHFWEDQGCNTSPGGAGAPPSGAANSGGNKAVCIPCETTHSASGMPVWWVSEPYINLFVADEPISYFQSDGNKWSFRWTYKQRDVYPLDPSFYSSDPLLPSRGTGMTNASWTHNFLSYVRFRDMAWDANPTCTGFPQIPINLTYQNFEAIVYLAGGGVMRFYKAGIADMSLTNGPSGTRIELLGGNTWNGTDPNTGFRLVYPDGSQDIYNYAKQAPSPCVSRRSQGQALLGERIDPQGRKNSVAWGNPTNAPFVTRVTQIIDYEGRTNSLFYANNTFREVPTQITDAYGRSAYFNCDGSGRLSTLVDAAGLTNTISYQNDSEGFITIIGTPYGNTYFTHFAAPTNQAGSSLPQGNSGGHDRINKYISILDRDNSREFYMYRYDSSFQTDSYPTNEIPAVPGNTFDNGTASSSGTAAGLRFRNSFYWGKKQMTLVSTLNPTNFTTNDYLYGRMRHWLDKDPISGDAGTLVSDRISLERAPSLDGTNEGFKTWYDYYGKSSNFRVGLNALIGTIATVLPDGTAQYATYNYLNSGQLTPRVRSRTSTFTYLGAPTTRTNTYGYAANGIDLTTHTFPDAKTERFVWDGYHQLLYHTNAVTEVTAFSYYDWRPWTVTYPNGFSTQFEYLNDALAITHPNYRMMSSFTDWPVARTIYFPEWTNGLPRRIVGNYGHSITNTWDSFNRLTSQSYTNGLFISNRYSKLDLFATKDPVGKWTYFAHDSMRRLTAVTNANTNITQYGYCGCGALETITDATLTNTNTISYDSQLRPYNVLLPDGTSMSYGYDAVGRRTSMTNGSAVWTFAYNNQDLVAAISNNFGQVQRVLYDERDRAVQITDAAGVTVTNTFDGINRLLTRAWPDNGIERFLYSTNGLVRYTNQLGAGTRYAYDTSGRLSAITNANTPPEITRFTYDVWGDLRELIDAKNQTNKWSYDVFGRMTNKVDASGQTVFGYSYDANGRLTNRWTPAKGGINTRFAYDPVGNLKSIGYPFSTNIAFDYDALNRVKEMMDAVGPTIFTYTRVGQLASEDGPWSNDTLTNVYSQRLRSSSTLGTSWTNNYGYDAARRLTNVTSGAGAFGYEFVGPSQLRSKLSLPNGASINDSYDNVAQLTNTMLLNSSLATLNAHSYTYDQWGQRLAGTSSASPPLTPAKWNYGYDAIGQLKTALPYDANNALITAQRVSYGYDGAGNLNFRTNDLAVRNFVTDKLNQLTNLNFISPLTVSGVTTTNATNVTVNGIAATLNADGTYAATVPVGGTTNSLTAIGYERFGRRATNTANVATKTLQYDANGNMLFDGTRGFAYDDENQLTNIVVTNVWKSEVVYDGFGRRRIRKEFTWASSTWTQTNEVRYVYDGLLVLQERDSNNVAKVTYTRGLDLGGGIQRAGGVGGLLARTDANGSSYYHADGNGNITALSDGSQNIVARYDYDPFGNLLSISGTLASANMMRFSSMEAHQPSSLVLYAFRAYSPNLQRFIQADPIGLAGGLNLHRFVGNDPGNEVDPFGWSEFNRTMVVNFKLQPPPVNVPEQLRPQPLPPNFQPEAVAPSQGSSIGLPDAFSRPFSRFQPSTVEGQFLTALGAAHLAGTEEGHLQFEFTATAFSALLPCPKIAKGLRVPKDLPKTLSPRQALHTPGPTLVPGRSSLTADAQKLLDGIHSGEYPIIRMNPRGQPVVDFGKEIGTHAGTAHPTQFGTVHYGKEGAHIVPANPIQY